MRVFLLLLFLVPTIVFAQETPAGFPPSTIWLSKTAPAAGESVTIYTVVYNSSDTLLAGDVVFLVDEVVVGTRPFSAAPGTTQIVSEVWTASEGTHAFAARIEEVTGASAPLASESSATQSVTVAAPPPPPVVVTQAAVAVDTVADTVETATPVVSGIASTTLATTENIRLSAVSVLENLASSTTHRQELAAAASAASPEANVAASFDIGATVQNIWQAMLGWLLFIFRSPLWFYVLIAVVLFIILAFIKTALSGRRR